MSDMVDSKSLNCLPNEILVNIYRLCDHKSAWKMFQTCRRLQNLYLDALYMPGQKDVKIMIEDQFRTIQIGRIRVKICGGGPDSREYTATYLNPNCFRGLLRRNIVANWMSDRDAAACNKKKNEAIRYMNLFWFTVSNTVNQMFKILREDFCGYLETLVIEDCTLSTKTSLFLEDFEIGHLILKRVVFDSDEDYLARFLDKIPFSEISIIGVEFDTREGSDILGKTILKKNILLNAYEYTHEAGSFKSSFHEIFHRNGHFLPDNLQIDDERGLICAERVIKALKNWFNCGGQKIQLWEFYTENTEIVDDFLSTQKMIVDKKENHTFLNINGKEENRIFRNINGECIIVETSEPKAIRMWKHTLS